MKILWKYNIETQKGKTISGKIEVEHKNLDTESKVLDEAEDAAIDDATAEFGFNACHNFKSVSVNPVEPDEYPFI